MFVGLRVRPNRPDGCGSTGLIVPAFILWLTLTAPGRADQIVVNSTNYPAAKILGYQEGRIQFRTAAGSLEGAWIDQVDLVIVDRGGPFVDFNQAERYLAGSQPQEAMVRYRRTLRLSADFWADLVESRLLAACARTGDLAQTALYYIRVVRGKRSGPTAAVRLMPRSISDQRDATVVRAIEQLENAISAAPNDEQRMPLDLFRYEILRSINDPRATSAAQRIAVMEIPIALHCERVYAVQLAAMKAAMSDEADPAELTGLDRAIRDCPREMLPSFLLLKGETLLRGASTREEIIRAAWPFMRVAIHMRKDPRAAEGLYGAARAVERLGRPDQAIALLEECLGHRQLTEEIRREANTALDRLRSEAPASD